MGALVLVRGMFSQTLEIQSLSSLGSEPHHK